MGAVPGGSRGATGGQPCRLGPGAKNEKCNFFLARWAVPGFQKKILNTGLFVHKLEAYFFSVEDEFSFRGAGKGAKFCMLRLHTLEAAPRVLRCAPP